MSSFRLLCRVNILRPSQSKWAPPIMTSRLMSPSALIERRNIAYAQKARFSVRSSQSDAVSEMLAAKLGSEYKFEADVASGKSDDPFITHFERLSFHPIDIPGQSKVTLTKKYKDEDIKLTFSVADVNNPDLPPDFADHDANDHAFKQGFKQGQAEINGNDGDQPTIDTIGVPSFLCNVDIEIRREGRNHILAFKAIAEGGEFLIDHIRCYPSTNEKGIYNGPPFSQLDEDVQFLFHQYLEERGIHTDLAVLIPEYIDWKEQKEYINWLGAIQEFVEYGAN